MPASTLYASSKQIHHHNINATTPLPPPYPDPVLRITFVNGKAAINSRSILKLLKHSQQQPINAAAVQVRVKPLRKFYWLPPANPRASM
jgi:hypothetical protein